MEKERLENWYAGELSDDELTDKEVHWLERRVFSAVAKKLQESKDVTVFQEHKTVQ